MKNSLSIFSRLNRCVEDAAELLVFIDQIGEQFGIHEFSSADHSNPDTALVQLFERNLQFVDEFGSALSAARFCVVGRR